MNNPSPGNLYLVTSEFKEPLPNGRSYKGVTVESYSHGAALIEFIRVWPHRIPLTVTRVNVNQAMPIRTVTENPTTYSV